MNQISAALHGFSSAGPKISTNIQAIYTLSICANIDQLSKLSALQTSSRYLQACLYTHAKTHTNLEWLQKEFEKDVELASKRLNSNIQFSSYAIGIALRKEDSINIISKEAETKIINKLCHVIRSGNLTSDQLTCCFLALGWICDQRQHKSQIESNIIFAALETIENIEDFYSPYIFMRCIKPKAVTVKMLRGDLLNAEEEQFLLTKLEL